MQPLPPAVVLGIDCLTGLQIARILWKKGVPVIGVAKDPNAAYCRTRAAVRIFSAAHFQDATQALLERLHDEFLATPVLMSATDDFVWWLDTHRDQIEPLAAFLIPPSETLALMADKSRFYRYAIENGLPLSDTRFVSSSAELSAAADEMSFPLLMKPARKTDEWMERSGGFKVLRVESADALLKTGRELLSVVDELILQRWVRGPDANMHSLYVCLDRSSAPLFESIVAKKLRQWPPDVGVGALALQVPGPDVVEAGLPLLRTLGYVGPGSFQFKQDEVTQKFYIIEMNTRTPLNYPLCEACGIEANYIHYCAAAGLPLPETRTITRPGGKWICWKTDLPSGYAHWKRGDLSLGEWFRSTSGHKRSGDICLSDPKPQLIEFGRKVRTGLSPKARATLFKK